MVVFDCGKIDFSWVPLPEPNQTLTCIGSSVQSGCSLLQTLRPGAGSRPSRKSSVSLGSESSPEDEKCLAGHKCNSPCFLFSFRLLSQSWMAYVIVADLFFCLSLFFFFFLKEHSWCILITTFRIHPNSSSSNRSCFSARKLVFHLL